MGGMEEKMGIARVKWDGEGESRVLGDIEKNN